MMMLLLALTSALLILGIYKHDSNLMYPTLVARLLFIVFVQVSFFFYDERTSYRLFQFCLKQQSSGALQRQCVLSLGLVTSSLGRGRVEGIEGQQQ